MSRKNKLKLVINLLLINSLLFIFMGIIFATLALFSWGVGDFLIQKSTRRLGDLVALFYVTAFGGLVLLPFVFKDFYQLLKDQPEDLAILFLTALIIMIAAILDFKALRVGKISVVEPIFAFEVPITVILGMIFIGEFLNLSQLVLMFFLVLGIILIAIKHFSDFKNIKVEAGVWLALGATAGMGIVNFLFGLSARQTSPLMINWFISVFIAFILFCYFVFSHKLHTIAEVWQNNKMLIFAVSLIDNLAWLFFAAATLYIPIAIATGFSESYIALAAGLGLIFNKEKLQPHQWIGLFLVVSAVFFLALVTI